MEQPSARETHLQVILHAYLQALDRGEQPDRQALLDAHPDLRTELAEYFADASKLERLAQSLRTAPFDAAPVASSTLGKIRYFGDYELLEEIARGGMGVVFKARQVSLNRIVALKMILKGELASEADVRRFRQEAEAAANLDHPNIVPIYEVGEHEGQQYFSMKLIAAGEPLQREPAVSAARQRQVAQLVATVARAVHHAHQRGILHRDLKPGNILIDQQGEPQVADFGLAKRLEGDAGQTRSGAIVGTPAYMAPEQARAEKALTTAVDVWSLGAILYEWLTGRPPFRGEDAVSTLLKVVNDEPVKASVLNPIIDQDLETICLKCLEKDSARRYGSAAALADDLERWLRGEPITARSVSQLERTWRWCRRKPAQAGLVALACLTLLGGVAATVLFALSEAEYSRKIGAEKLNTDRELKRANKNYEDLLAAEKGRREGLRLAANLTLERGLTLCNQHDVGGGMLWLARSLVLAPPDDAGLQQAIRGNLATWRPELLTLQGIFLDPAADQAALEDSGQTVVTHSYNSARAKQPKRWSVATGQPLPAVPTTKPKTPPTPAFLPKKSYKELLTSPDGKLLLALDQSVVTPGRAERPGTTAQLWDVAAGQPIGEPFTHLSDAHFSSDSRCLLTIKSVWLESKFDAAGDWKGDEAYLWRIVGGKLLGTRLQEPGANPQQKPEHIKFALLSPKGDVAVTGGEAVRVWSLQGEPPIFGECLWNMTKRYPGTNVVAVEAFWNDLRFSADGRLLLSKARAIEKGALRAPNAAYETRQVLLWDPRSGRLVGRPVSLLGVSAAVFSADDAAVLIATSKPGEARVWKLAVPRAEDKDLLSHVWAVSPDGRTAMTSTWQLEPARLRDLVSGQQFGQPLAYPNPEPVLIPWQPFQSAVFSKDGTTLATLCRDDTIRCWNARTGVLVGPPQPVPKKLLDWQLSLDGRLLATVARTDADFALALTAVATGQRLGKGLQQKGLISSLAFAADGKTLAVGVDRAVELWNLDATGLVLRTRTLQLGEKRGATALLFSQDGKTLACASPDHVLWWSLTAENAPIAIPNPNQSIFGIVPTLAFSPDGTILAVGSDDHACAIQCWCVATGHSLGPALPVAAGVLELAYLADGKNLLVRVGDPGSLRMMPQARRCTLPPAALSGEAGHLILWTQVLTGKELLSDGTTRALDWQTWQERRQQLEKVGWPMPGR